MRVSSSARLSGRVGSSSDRFTLASVLSDRHSWGRTDVPVQLDWPSLMRKPLRSGWVWGNASRGSTRDARRGDRSRRWERLRSALLGPTGGLDTPTLHVYGNLDRPRRAIRGMLALSRHPRNR